MFRKNLNKHFIPIWHHGHLLFTRVLVCTELSLRLHNIAIKKKKVLDGKTQFVQQQQQQIRKSIFNEFYNHRYFVFVNNKAPYIVRTIIYVKMFVKDHMQFH